MYRLGALGSTGTLVLYGLVLYRTDRYHIVSSVSIRVCGGKCSLLCITHSCLLLQSGAFPQLRFPRPRHIRRPGLRASVVCLLSRRADTPASLCSSARQKVNRGLGRTVSQGAGRAGVSRTVLRWEAACQGQTMMLVWRQAVGKRRMSLVTFQTTVTL